MKKIILIIMSILVALNLIISPDVVHANLVSKPISIAAKKAAKIPIKNTAVEMANQIVSEYLVRELIEGVKTDEGYSPVCMDGKKDNIKDCHPDKRAQVKTKLSSTDKSKLEKTVESVLEKKTNTSSKWGKFLDIFVPLFLVSGAIEIISASLDGDILSFFDEIAQDALVESDLLKPLFVPPPAGSLEQLDFNKHVESVDVVFYEEDLFNVLFDFSILLKPNVTLGFSLFDGNSLREFSASTSIDITLRFSAGTQIVGTGENRYFLAEATGVDMFRSSGTNYFLGNAPTLWRGSTKYYPVNGDIGPPQDLAYAEGRKYLLNYWGPMLSDSSVNARMNTLRSMMTTNPKSYLKFDDSVNKLQPPEVKTDYGKQTATDKIKDANGNVPLKGINSFTFKYGDTHIYPSGDSQTGWKDKTTGEDITVVEDDIVVDDNTIPPKEDDETENGNSCEKPKKPDFKPFTEAFTTSFPFSIPWDIGRAIDAAFGGIGNDRPTFDLSGIIPGAVLTIPDYFDSFMPFVRSFLLLSFDVGLVYLFARFMGRGGDG